MEESLTSLSASEVAPTEDIVTALLEVLVDPVLPLKLSGKDAPSLEEQQSVAKQMHAVVVLYNYFQRKRHPELEFLGFESFCKLAVNLRPVMRSHMNFMYQSDYTVSRDLENQLSITEMAILDACKLCLALDVSKDVPDIEEWPISKVAVLVVDSSEKTCALLFSSVTHGVWSVIEKGVEICDVSSGSTVTGNKRKRISKKDMGEDQGDNEAGYQLLASSAVKEATVMDQNDLLLLESHVVYSLSKEKTAARFYIVKCMTPIKEILQVPIKDVVESLQGPLVKKISGSWTVTPVVEFFHVLPYAGILSKWVSREVSSSSAKYLGVFTSNFTSKEANGASTGSPKEISNGYDMVGPTCSVSAAQSVEFDGTPAVVTQKVDNIKNSRMAGKVYRHHKRTLAAKDEASVTFSVKTRTTDFAMNNYKDQMVESVKKNCISLSKDKVTMEDRALIPLLKVDMKYPEKVESVLSEKEKEITMAALRVLFRKREQLTHKLRTCGDELAICEKNIKAISDDSEDHLALKIKMLVEFCNDECLVGNTWAANDIMAQQEKGQRLSEANFVLQIPCQELDDICNANMWTLPKYHVSLLDGGYVASVVLRGLDFEWSCYGDMHSSPREARNSAATQMIAKLRFSCPTK